jgi:hypothetical protein
MLDRSDPTSPTFLLDLDLCSQYGNDTFDLLNLAQTEKQSEAFMLSLMSKLLNPSMLCALRQLVAKHPNARVCLYTMKGGILRGGGVPSSLVHDSEGYVPSNITYSDYIELGVNTKMHGPVMRVFLARDAIQEALGLKSAPEIIICGSRKSVRHACTTLLQPPTNPDLAFLWDDNKDIKDDFHVFTVPEYKAMPPALADAVNDDLEVMYPERKITNPKLVAFLAGAPAGTSSYDPSTKRVFVRVAQDPLPEWPVPDLPVITEQALALFFTLALSVY